MKKYLKKIWRINILAILVTILVLAIQVMHSCFMMWMTQELMNKDLNGFVIALLAIVVLVVVQLLLSFAQSVLQGKAVRSMNNQLRYDMGKVLIKRDYEEFHHQEVGQYLSWFTNDMNQIEQIAWYAFYELVGAVAQVIFAMLALAYIHWALLLTSLIMAIVILIIPRLFNKKMEQKSLIFKKKQEEGVSNLKDLLAGYDILKFFGKTSRFIQGIHQESDRMEREKYKLLLSKKMVENIMALVSVLCQASVLALIGILSVRGFISTSVIMGGGNLCGMVYNGINKVSQLRLSLTTSKPYFEKLQLTGEDNVSHIVNGEVKKIRSSIELQNLNFNYGEREILKNINLKFEVGKKYALTGPSGCGKSTLLKILLGWLPDYRGNIRIDGNDIRNDSVEQMQEQMGYIEQNVYLFNTSVRDNITLGEVFTEAELQRALHDSALIEDLSSMPNGLDTVVGEEGRNLSGGQKQRVAIARALIHNRSILLVDEGTSALDKQNADIVERSLLANPDLTLILVSHHLSEERKKQFDMIYELS